MLSLFFFLTGVAKVSLPLECELDLFGHSFIVPSHRPCDRQSETDSERTSMSGHYPVTDKAQPEAFDTLHSRLLLGFPALVAELGGDPGKLLASVELWVQPDGEIGPGVTYTQLAPLLELAAVELQCPDFGLRLAALQDTAESFGPLGQVMRRAPTLGDALEYVAGHNYAHSLAARVWRRWSAGGKKVFLGHDLLIEGVPNKAQAMELVLLVGHRAASELTAGRARVRRVCFRHQPISSPATYRRYFGCEVRFGQQDDGVEFSARDLTRRVISPDATSFAEIIDAMEANFTRRRPPLHAQTRGVIMHLLGAGECTNKQVARELSLHPRTLHRRLRSESTSFQKIKDEVRSDLLLYYLQQTDLDISMISEKLGFAEQAVMSRSCRRWFSASPTDIRRSGKFLSRAR